MKTLTINEIQQFWRDHEDYIPSVDREKFILLGPNPRYIEFPWAYECYEEAQPKVMLECGSSHVDRDYFKIYWDLILEKGEPHGVDITPLRTDRYTHLVSNERLKKLKTCISDLRSLPFKNESFDMIFCISTLEHVGFEVGKISTPESPNAIDRNVAYPSQPNQHRGDFQAFGELMRTLRLGGQLVLTVPYELNVRYMHQVDSMGFTATEIVYDEARLNALVDSTGAKIKSQQLYYEDLNGGWKLASTPFPSNVKQGVACLLIERV